MPVFLTSKVENTKPYSVALGERVKSVSTLRALDEYLKTHQAEELVFFTADIEMSTVEKVLSKYRLSSPQLGFILIRTRLEVATLRHALQLGVNDVVAVHDAASLVSAAKSCRERSRLLRLQQGAEPEPSKKAKIALVFSAKGGCGKTTVATNLAESLAQQSDKSVCLVDLDLQFGDVSAALQLEPNKTISHALKFSCEADFDEVETLLTETHLANLKVLLAPVDPTDIEFVSADLVEKLIAKLSEQFDYLVIDSPPALNSVILKAFDVAHECFLLTTLDVPSVKNLKLTLTAMEQLGLPKDRLKVVVNRSTQTAGLSLRQVEKTLGHPVHARIPESSAVPNAINQGHTVVRASSKHRVSKAMASLAQLVSA